MSVNLSPIGGAAAQFFDNNGNPLAGGKLYTYAAGTTTPLATYTTSAGNVPHTNPIILDSAGRVPGGQVWLTDGSVDYKFLLETSFNVLVGTFDNIPPAISGDASDIAVVASTYNAGATVQAQLTNVGSTTGATNVGYTPAGTGAVATTVQAKLRESVSVLDFMTDAQKANVAAGTGTIDISGAIQAAIDSLPATGGEVLLFSGRGLVSSPIKTKTDVVIRGYGDSTILLVNTDIEVFNSDIATVNSTLFRAEFYNFYIKKTVTTATTKYDIHLQNPNVCKFDNVHIQSGHIDTAYSATNVGGIWLDKPAGSTASAFMNRVHDCWIQNNSVYFKNVTDSTITGGFIWGHTRQFAIRFAGGGANAVENVVGLICSKFNGGIWLDGAGINQTRIIGNEFDGNPSLDTGTGVYAPALTITTLISANTFWGCDKHGVDVTDPVGLTITGNNFWKNNASDNFFDDVRITGVNFQPNGNTVTGNAHVIDEARVNKGYAIREVNGGFAPTQNTYSSNGILGVGYLSPGILVVKNSSVIGNSGLGSEQIAQLLSNKLKLNVQGLIVNNNAALAVAGTFDFAIGVDSYVGTLNVAATRTDFPPQSRRGAYTAMAYGTTGVFTLIGGVQDGSGGGTPFTLTAPSSGVIRLTNTSGTVMTVHMSFFGNTALG